jgi:hypothetical protein
MAVAIVGLIGVVFGAVVALFGAAWSDRRQARIQEIRYNREQRTAAYEGAIRYLNRAANRRSELLFGATGSRAFLKGDQVSDWFDDLVEAQCWLRLLATRCGRSQMPRIREAVDLLEAAGSNLDRGTSRDLHWPDGRAEEMMRSGHLGGIMHCSVIEATNPAGIQPIMQVIDRALELVTSCARMDSGSTIDVGGYELPQLTFGGKQ